MAKARGYIRHRAKPRLAHKLVLYHNGRYAVRLKNGLPRGNIYLLRGFGRKVGVKLYALFNKIIAVAVHLLPILKP